MPNSINIVLFQCKKELNAGLKKIERHHITIITEEEELITFCHENKNNIIVYEGAEKNEVKHVFNKINNPLTFLLILLNAREAKKFNYKKHHENRVIYFSMPPNLQELLQLIDMIYKAKRLIVALKDQEDMFHAYEQASELSRQELMNAYKNIEAHENLRTLDESEMVGIKESLAAWEKVSELSRRELMEYQKEKEAYYHLLEYIQNENLFKDKVIKAWEQVMEMGRKELLKLYEDMKHDIKQIKKEEENHKASGQ